MQSLLEVIWNKVEYDLKDSQKAACQLEECSYSKVMKILLNGRTLKYHVWGGRFHMIPRSYKFSQSLCLNNFFQVWLILNQGYQVTLFRSSNWYDEVSHLVRGRKVLGVMQYLMRSVKRSLEAVGIWTEDNWDVKRVNSFYTMVSGGVNFKINESFVPLSWSFVVMDFYTRRVYIIG